MKGSIVVAHSTSLCVLRRPVTCARRVPCSVFRVPSAVCREGESTQGKSPTCEEEANVKLNETVSLQSTSLFISLLHFASRSKTHTQHFSTLTHPHSIEEVQSLLSFLPRTSRSVIRTLMSIYEVSFSSVRPPSRSTHSLTSKGTSEEQNSDSEVESTGPALLNKSVKNH